MGTKLKSIFISLYAKSEEHQEVVRWLRWVAFSLGFLAIALPPNPYIAAIALLLHLATAYQLREASKLYGAAERVKRTHEYCDGIGLQPNRYQIAVLRSETDGIGEKLDRDLWEGARFASVADVGPKRLLCNLRESAWFTVKGAEHRLSEVKKAIVILAVLFFLILAVPHLFSYGDEKLFSVSTALIYALFSFGLIRDLQGLSTLRQAAEKAVTTADQMVQEDSLDLKQAMVTCSEYQLVRAESPPIPTRIWKSIKEDLNKLYKEEFE